MVWVTEDICFTDFLSASGKPNRASADAAQTDLPRFAWCSTGSAIFVVNAEIGFAAGLLIFVAIRKANGTLANTIHTLQVFSAGSSAGTTVEWVGLGVDALLVAARLSLEARAFPAKLLRLNFGSRVDFTDAVPEGLTADHP